MTNATKTLSGIFIVLAILLGLNYGVSNSGSSKAFRATPVQVDTTKVDRVVIDNQSGHNALELIKDNGKWMVKVDTAQYPADQKRVQQTLKTMNGLTIKSVVTRNPEKFSRFRVDSTGTRVGIFNGKKEMAAFIIGAPQFLSQTDINTYVRLADQDEVIAVNGFLASDFTTETDSWRDKTIWDFDKTSITEIEFQFPADSSFSIYKKNNDWYSLTDSLDQTRVGRMLNQLASVKASGFTGGQGMIHDPLYSINITLDNGSIRVLSLKPVENDKSFYQASANGFPYIFKVSKSSWDRTVLPGRKAFLPKK